MARRYVSPTGNTPAGYDNYYTDVQAAIAALANGDEIVLEKSLAHTWSYNASVPQKNEISFVMRNEDDDEDFDACVVTVTDDASLYMRSATDVGMKVSVKGITFSGPTGGYANWTGNSTGQPRAGLFRFAAVCVGITARFTGVKFRRMRWTVSSAFSSSNGLTVMWAPATGSSGNKSYMKRVHWEDCQAPECTAASWNNFLWLVRDVEVGELAGCTVDGCGLPDASSGILGRLTCSGYDDTSLFLRDTHWADCYAYTKAGADVPDGCAVYAWHDNSTICEAFSYSCTFQRMKAGKGGALWAGLNSDLYMYRPVFVDTASASIDFGGGASGRGGVTDNADLGRSEFYDGLFLRCHSASHGGALRSVGFNGQLVAARCTFAYCTADRDGQAIYADELSSAYVTEQVSALGCAFLGDGVQLFGVNDGGFGTIDRNFFSGGVEAAVQDAGATITNTVTGDLLLSQSYRPQAGSALIERGAALPWRIDAAGRLSWVRPAVGAYEPVPTV